MRAFVCPQCGYIDKKGYILTEVCKERVELSISPSSYEIIDEDRDSLECAYVRCGNCGEEFDFNNHTVDYQVENLLVEIEETDEEVKVAPVGEFWLQNPQKLIDVITVSTGKRVEVVSIADVGA